MSDAMSLCKSCPIEQAVNLIQKKGVVKNSTDGLNFFKFVLLFCSFL